jgi:hypothetical protein
VNRYDRFCEIYKAKTHSQHYPLTAAMYAITSTEWGGGTPWKLMIGKIQQYVGTYMHASELNPRRNTWITMHYENQD